MNAFRADVDESADSRLLDLSRQGDRRAFSELWRMHSPVAVSYARSLGSGPLDPEDLVSEAFLAILRLLRAGKGPNGKLRPYLLTTIRNMHYSALSRTPQSAPLELADSHETNLSTIDVETMVNSTTITEAFRSLPDRWQNALWLSEVEQLPARTIAEVLGLRPNSVAALTYRAREALRKAWIGAHLRQAPRGSEHARVISLLGGYARNDLSTRLHRLVATHLESCASCDAAASEARHLARTMALAPFLVGGAGLVIAPSLFTGDAAAASTTVAATSALGGLSAVNLGTTSSLSIAATVGTSVSAMQAALVWPIAAATVVAVSVGGTLLAQVPLASNSKAEPIIASAPRPPLDTGVTPPPHEPGTPAASVSDAPEVPPGSNPVDTAPPTRTQEPLTETPGIAPLRNSEALSPTHAGQAPLGGSAPSDPPQFVDGVVPSPRGLPRWSVMPTVTSRGDDAIPARVQISVSGAAQWTGLVVLDGVRPGTNVQLDPAGSWRRTFDVPAGSGQHEVTLEYTDERGKPVTVTQIFDVGTD